MNKGAITGYIDVAQVVLYVFWIFFAAIIIYLRKEDKREGYPLESDRSGGRIDVRGFPGLPKPKTFLLREGGTAQAPRVEKDLRQILARPTAGFPGAPLSPIGNPMIDAVGPASYAERSNHPDHAVDGLPILVPGRAAPDFFVSLKDPDPRGMSVRGADRALGGVVVDIWVDRAEVLIRYIEVEATNGRRVLLPMPFCRFDATRRTVNVASILGSQFDTVPGIANPDQVTRREEDRITAYYSSGHLYATAARSEPWL